MMRVFFLFFVSLFASITLFAQQEITEIIVQDSCQLEIMNDLDVNRDARLDKMVKWHIEKNEKMEGINGFRVEVFFSSTIDARERARNTKAAFLKDYPDYPVHIKFVAPNFRVRVGDFRTKNEAWKLYKTIQQDYPSAFIVPDVIEFPLLKQN